MSRLQVQDLGQQSQVSAEMAENLVGAGGFSFSFGRPGFGRPGFGYGYGRGGFGRGGFGNPQFARPGFGYYRPPVRQFNFYGGYRRPGFGYCPPGGYYRRW